MTDMVVAVDCGIDIGSTNVKVVFVRDGGEVLWSRSQASPRARDGFGLITHPLLLVERLEEMISQGWRELKLSRPLRSITTTGIGEDGCCVDDTLTPLEPAIAWFDRRAFKEAQMLAADRSFLHRTGNVVDETRSAAKWLWLHKNRPAELAADARWLTLTDFPSAWWAGKAFMSSTLAARTACFDITARTWVQELLTATHARGLPEVLDAGTIVGGMRHGPLTQSGAASSATALVAGGHDHPIAASLIRRLDANARVDSLGTANLIYGETERFADVELLKHLAFSNPPSGKAIACLGVVEFSEAVQKLTDTESLRAFLSQQHVPGEPPGSMHELKERVKNHQLRGIVEDLSLRSRKFLSVMDEAGAPPGKIYTTGGWSRSKAFVELRASVFGQPIVAMGDIEMTALGAAMFGAEATDGVAALPREMLQAGVVDPVLAWAKTYEELAESEW